MRILKIVKHEAGVFDFLNKKSSPSIPESKAQEFEQLKDQIFTIYTKINNAYKIYFQGARLKNQQNYRIEEYVDKQGIRRKRKVQINSETNKIEFQGNWPFKLGEDKTSLGQAIHSLYDFLNKITNLNYTKTPDDQSKKPTESPKTEQPKPETQKPEGQSKPTESPKPEEQPNPSETPKPGKNPK